MFHQSVPAGAGAGGERDSVPIYRMSPVVIGVRRQELNTHQTAGGSVLIIWTFLQHSYPGDPGDCC